MKKEIQAVIFFLVLQNILFICIFYLGFQTVIGQAIGNIILGGFLYWYLEHEERIKDRLKGTVEFIPIDKGDEL